MNSLGFMQGRLSRQIDGKIQAFPTLHWRDEFPIAQTLGLSLMEWTLDHDGLSENPFMTLRGREQIRQLSESYCVSVPSVTGDCFMQAPFWKTQDSLKRESLLKEFDSVIAAASDLGVNIIVVPVVDNGRIESEEEANILREELLTRSEILKSNNVQIAFESDLQPMKLADWISHYPVDCFGINYDTGNSAALGYHPYEEWRQYGSRVINVHIKDRLLGGTTIPLGQGACDFHACFSAMRESGYTGHLILQTARDAEGDHAGAIQRHTAFVRSFMM